MPRLVKAIPLNNEETRSRERIRWVGFLLSVVTDPG